MSEQVRKFLSNLCVDRIAKKSKFIQRKPRKISAKDFLVSFMIIFCKPNFSFRQWACQLSLLLGQDVSFQILCRKCNINCLNFIQQVLDKAIEHQLRSTFRPSIFTSYFGRILIEDSTCFKLSNSMLKAFSGAGNRKSNVAMCKTHFCFNLLNMNTLDYKLTKINENDASQSANILEYLKPNDLVLRDMGYLSNKILNQIAKKSAYYISKVKHNYKYFLPENGNEFDLAKALGKASRKGQGTFVKTLIIGKQNKLQATLIAVKLTAEQVDKKVKKYYKKNSRKKEMSKAKKQLLAWSIMITNIEDDKIEIDQIFKLYTLRWQVELLFKTWKSRFGINTILQNYTGNDPNKILILLYLSLLFCTIVFRPLFIKYKQLMKSKFNKKLSLQKFASLVINHLSHICKETKQIESLVIKLGCHDNRNDMKAHQELILSSLTMLG